MWSHVSGWDQWTTRCPGTRRFVAGYIGYMSDLAPARHSSATLRWPRCNRYDWTQYLRLLLQQWQALGQLWSPRCPPHGTSEFGSCYGRWHSHSLQDLHPTIQVFHSMASTDHSQQLKIKLVFNVDGHLTFVLNARNVFAVAWDYP